MPENITTGVNDWDFENYHVSSNIDPDFFISSDTVLVAAGPREFKASGAIDVYPVGVVENFTYSEGRQLQRIYEIGSALSYFVVGRAMGTIQMGQIYFNGPSLASALYGAYKLDVKNENVTIEPLVTTSQDKIDLHTKPGFPRKTDNRGFTITSMFSDLFRRSFGLLLYFKDVAGNPIGGLYFERAYISGRQQAMTAGAIVVAEGVGIEYTRSIPVDATTSTFT